MLFGNINKMELLMYTDAKLRSFIDEAVTIANLQSEGKYTLSDDRCFVVITEATTQPINKRVAEIHKKHIDIQILLEGRERLGYSNILDEPIKKLSSLDDDILFIDNVVNENFVDLAPGDFVVFYPNQIHRPLCSINQPIQVKKAIIKIPYEIFT